jgi:hypothetical protein
MICFIKGVDLLKYFRLAGGKHTSKQATTARLPSSLLSLPESPPVIDTMPFAGEDTAITESGSCSSSVSFDRTATLTAVFVNVVATSGWALGLSFTRFTVIETVAGAEVALPYIVLKEKLSGP